MLRTLLNFAEKNFIPLDEELNILNMYMELESLRFDQSFSYEITVDDNLTNDEILLPSLMIQPFAINTELKFWEIQPISINTELQYMVNKPMSINTELNTSRSNPYQLKPNIIHGDPTYIK